ncbi:MAG: glutamate--tRNA ligase, partial [Hyphomicrobiaceae bacterium]|nr:glutamate--tRNA ligase [Hyphomicrobiaceae bacterium]
AVAAILDGLTWLELGWKGEAVSQFARADRHREVAEAMLATGGAYRCYMTKDEIDAMRAEAEANKQPFVVKSPWRDRDPASAQASAAGGAPYTIRLKAPRDGETVVEDAVQGRVVFPNKDLDDLIILRSDGNPTYNLAVVVDDHDMGVTHVIRGVDHLTNAARQAQIYAANGWSIPQFAHVPLIHGADGAKLSKRHGALGIEAYRAMGYLPEALRNYLVRLGWSHGDDEIIPTAQLIEWFDLGAIGRSPARLDLKKLEDINAHYIKTGEAKMLVARCRDLLEKYTGDFAALIAEHDPKVQRGDLALARNVLALLPGVSNGPALAARFSSDGGWARFEALLPAIRERAKTLSELIDGALFLVQAMPLTFDDRAAKQLDPAARANIGALISRLAAVSSFDSHNLEAVVRSYAEETGSKLGSVAQPLRAALTGRTVSPPVFDVMAVLGRDEALARLKAASS